MRSWALLFLFPLLLLVSISSINVHQDQALQLPILSQQALGGYVNPVIDSNLPDPGILALAEGR